MEAKQFVDKLYEACAKSGLDAFQISYSRRNNEKISWFDGKIDAVSNNEVQAVVLKVKKGKNIGAFACEELEEKNINKIISQAVENAELIDEEEENFFHDGSGVYQSVVKYAPLADKLKQLDRAAFLADVEKAVYALDSRINKIIVLSLGLSESSLILRNSKGLDLEDQDVSAYASLFLSVKEGDVVKTGGYAVGFDKPEDFSPEFLAKKAATKALAKLGASDIVSQKTSVVFENRTFADLLEVFSGIFSANAVQEKRSKLAGKLGSLIASNAVTLIDDPFWEKGYGSRSFDGEGYPAQKNEVVKDGLLQTFLHNLRTADKDGVKSTGNGSGGRGISFSNFYLAPGVMSKEEVLSKLGNGLYIDGLSGLHAGFNSVSGDFSFGAQGFLVEQGKITKPLNQFTISGNVYNLLKDIQYVGNDLLFDLTNFGSPTVMADNITVANS